MMQFVEETILMKIGIKRSFFKMETYIKPGSRIFPGVEDLRVRCCNGDSWSITVFLIVRSDFSRVSKATPRLRRSAHAYCIYTFSIVLFEQV